MAEIETAECCICGFTVTTHPDDSQGGLAYCGDCGKPTCAAHRDGTQAERCHRCAGKLMTLSKAIAVAKAVSRALVFTFKHSVVMRTPIDNYAARVRTFDSMAKLEAWVRQRRWRLERARHFS